MIRSIRHRLIAIIALVLLITLFGKTLLLLNTRRGSIKSFYPPSPLSNETVDAVDWTKYAYVQHATTQLQLCKSVMLFETLNRLGCKAGRLLMYPSEFSPDGESAASRLLKKARDEFKTTLKPIEVKEGDVYEGEFLPN